MTIAFGPVTVTAPPAGRWQLGYVEGAPVSGDVSTAFGVVDGVHPTPHTGIDIAAVEGTPIVAPAAGTVRAAYMSPDTTAGSGNTLIVTLDSGEGEWHCYHMRDAALVRVGDHVAAGETVGYVGSTGHSTGPHLHFGFFLYAITAYIDPTPYLVHEIPVEAPAALPTGAVEGASTQSVESAVLARIYQDAVTRGRAGVGGISYSDDGDHYTVTVKK